MNILTAHQMEQLGRFNDCFVMHPQVKVIFNDFDDLRLNRNFQSDQQCMLLTGDTGVGKSHLINNYKKRVLASQTYSRTSMPVLVTRISSHKGLDATLRQMLTDLESFGSQQRKGQNYKIDLKTQLVKNLVRANVELLIFNEFQELIEFKTPKERQTIANELKFISEEARVPIVLVGMPWTEQIAEEPQWSSRLIRRRKLEYFSLQKDSKYYRQYLIGLAKHMPFDEPPKIEDKHIAIPLFAACRGESRALNHLLSETLKLVMVNGDRSLDIRHLAQTYRKLYESQESETTSVFFNPFLEPLDKVLISEVVKPSRYNPNAMTPDDMLIKREFSVPSTLAQLLSK
ncbi:TniB family NTP-binding protein [Shewanella sp. SR43-4]|uniref:TniB family NTP-binding protein n=1 Tax=Shewanella sp. SR43-4 TaxID=2760942 RepID=UPI00217600F6|nr:TniB family NTP-binding protein [Shewanella sp. SR43-4]